MSSLPKQRYTPQQYIEMERKAEFKSEYVNGFVWPLSHPCPEFYSPQEAKLRHEEVMQNTPSALRQRLPDSDVHPGIWEADITVMRREEQIVILQILSPETEGQDRGGRFARQRRNPWLLEYVLISQERPFIERHRRQSANVWTLTESAGLEARLLLPGVGRELPLSQIYARVGFPPESVLPDVSGA